MRTPEQLRADSRRLRHEQTPAESLLWQNLRAKRLNGAKFRRQHPIADHIVDFCCLRYRLVIEIDGAQHAEPEEEQKDAARTARLEKQGYKVIRFWNGEVMTSLNGVLSSIAEALSEREKELAELQPAEAESQS